MIINADDTLAILFSHPPGVAGVPLSVFAQYVFMAALSILSNSAKFSAARTLFPAHNFFSATMATTYSTYHLGCVASLKFLAIENMSPHFSAHVYNGQTAGWIRIPLRTDVGLGPGDIVLDGDPASSLHAAPTFRPTALAASPQARILLITHTVD